MHAGGGVCSVHARPGVPGNTDAAAPLSNLQGSFSVETSRHRLPISGKNSNLPDTS
jgi:hypothetical protein